MSDVLGVQRLSEAGNLTDRSSRVDWLEEVRPVHLGPTVWTLPQDGWRGRPGKSGAIREQDELEAEARGLLAKSAAENSGQWSFHELELEGAPGRGAQDA